MNLPKYVQASAVVERGRGAKQSSTCNEKARQTEEFGDTVEPLNCSKFVIDIVHGLGYYKAALSWCGAASSSRRFLHSLQRYQHAVCMDLQKGEGAGWDDV